MIPWKQLSKEPLVLKIEDVYAIVTPDLCKSDLRNGSVEWVHVMHMYLYIYCVHLYVLVHECVCVCKDGVVCL